MTSLNWIELDTNNLRKPYSSTKIGNWNCSHKCAKTEQIRDAHRLACNWQLAGSPSSVFRHSVEGKSALLHDEFPAASAFSFLANEWTRGAHPDKLKLNEHSRESARALKNNLVLSVSLALCFCFPLVFRPSRVSWVGRAKSKHWQLRFGATFVRWQRIG